MMKRTVYVTFTRTVRIEMVQTQTVEIDVPVTISDDKLKESAKVAMTEDGWTTTKQEQTIVNAPYVESFEEIEAVKWRT